MIVATGATSVSVDVQIVDDSGLPVTGLVAASFPAVSYSLAGPQAAVSISLSNLAAITSAWSSGGLKERAVGYYRLDVPNAAFSSTGTIRLEGEATGKHLLAAEIQVGTVPTAVDALSVTNLNTMGADYVGGAFNVHTVTNDVAGNVAGNVFGNVQGSVAHVLVVDAGAITTSSFAAGAIDSTAAPNLDVAVSTRAVAGDAMTLTAGERTSVADALLGRNVAGGSSTGRLVKEAFYSLRNKVAIVGTTMTVYATDDVTPAWTSTLTTDAAAAPITVSDPA